MNILLGITGGIAAYKCATLVRELKKSGADVRVVMSQAAKDFITPLTMATLSGNPILVENFDPSNGAWNSHISLGEWADVYVIAPATANTLAKMTVGVADNLLLTTYLSARCPVWVAPAMDLDMYAHPTTQSNLNALRERGVGVIEPGEGFLASGLMGKGRMAEPEAIAQRIISALKYPTEQFKDTKVMITAGGTVENIDPVRFISNYSSGKMGVALASLLAQMGAKVTLLKANTTVEIPQHENLTVRETLSAEDMYTAAKEEFPRAQIAIFAAAVADYTPKTKADKKIKHTSDNMEITLVPTVDIAAAMGKLKRKDQITVGFALETDNESENALKKLDAKNLDAIVLNSLRDAGAGFGGDTNKISIINQRGAKDYDLKSKAQVAGDIVNYISTLL